MDFFLYHSKYYNSIINQIMLENIKSINLFTNNNQNFNFERILINSIKAINAPYKPKNNISNLDSMNNLFQEILNLFPNCNKGNSNIIHLNEIDCFDNDINNKNNNDIYINLNNEGNNIKISAEKENIQNNNNNKKKGKKNIKIRLLKNKKRGRINKNIDYTKYNIVHKKGSKDNMMRKIKNKALKSAYDLINFCIKKDNNKNLKRINRIKGIYGSELNTIFNLYFITLELKEIFSFNKSPLHYNEKDDNTITINEIMDTKEEEYFQTKKLLKMHFHEFYHKIFLNEDKELIKEIINNEKNIYNFDYCKSNIINKDNNSNSNINENENIEKINNNEKYMKNLEDLAKNYEDYFLKKNKRQSKKIDKKNYDNIIEEIINNNINNYNNLKEQVKEIKNKYTNEIKELDEDI